MKNMAIALIKLYQLFLSPFLVAISGGQVCRFSPTCSEFTKQKIQKYGIIQGSYLGFRQLLHCNPWFKALPRAK